MTPNSLISTLSHINFHTHTMQTNGDQITIVKKTFLRKERYVYPGFDKALDLLLNYVRSHFSELERQESVLDFFRLVEKLYEETNVYMYYLASNLQDKITQIAKGALLQKLEHSAATPKKVLKKFVQTDRPELTENWVRFFKNGFIYPRNEKFDGNEGLFLYENVLFVRPSAFAPTTEKKEKEVENRASFLSGENFKQQITGILEQYPQISEVQFFGGTKISKNAFLEFVNEISSSLAHLSPIYFIGSDPSQRILLHPLLVSRSAVLNNYCEFNESELKKSEIIENFDIDSAAIADVNQCCANNFGSLNVNEFNWEKILEVAHFLNLPGVIDKCKQFLEKKIASEMAVLPSYAKSPWEVWLAWYAKLKEWASEINSMKVEDHLAIQDFDEFETKIQQLVEVGFDPYSLDFKLSWITNEQFKLIADHFSQLTSLNLARTFFLDERIVPDLVRFEQLQVLNLAWSHSIVTNLAPVLEKLKHLRSLDLTHCHSAWNSIDFKSDSLKQLRSLNLAECQGFNSPKLSELANLIQLRSLNLSYCLLGDQVRVTLDDRIGVILPAFKHLQVLNLGGNNITNKICSSLLKLEELQKLTLCNCCNLTDEAVFELAKLKKLTSLSLAGCPKLTSRIIPALKEMKNLKDLDLSGCHESLRKEMQDLIIPGLKVNLASNILPRSLRGTELMS